MKTVCWGLLGASVLCFLIAAIGNLVGDGRGLVWANLTWWRGAVGLALYALAIHLLSSRRTA